MKAYGVKDRWMKACLLLILAFFFFVGEIPAVQAANDIKIKRIYGSDRYLTAIEISKSGWDKAETVVVVTGEDYADALAGAPLAYYYNAPILLTRPNELREELRGEIKRLEAKKVIILGGEAAVSSQVERALDQLEGVQEVVRIGGGDRYETAVKVAGHLPLVSGAVLAYGRDFPDALSIAPQAARQGMPIFLTDGKTVDSASLAMLVQYQRIYLIGGKSVIPQDVEDQLVNQGLQVIRLGGANRYETAVRIAEHFGITSSQVMLASGQKFADALTGSLLAAKKNLPLLLTRQDRIVPELVQFNGRYQPQSYLIVGGEQAVSEEVIRPIKGIDGTVKIFIDPGHGGGDPGAVGNGLREKDLTLDIALRLRDILINEYKNVQVLMSRDKDVSLTLKQRTDMANGWGADYFVSVHINAGGGRGFESYIYNGKVSQNTIPYQQIIHDHVAKGLAQKYGVKDRGKKRQNYHVLRESKMPAILFEILFIDNAEDAKLLKNDQFRQDVARLIAEGLAKVFHLPKK